jgi:hypothetical protein
MMAELCGTPIVYVTPGGTRGEEPCDLAPLHEGAHDSSQLLLRPDQTITLPLAYFGDA